MAETIRAKITLHIEKSIELTVQHGQSPQDVLIGRQIRYRDNPRELLQEIIDDVSTGIQVYVSAE